MSASNLFKVTVNEHLEGLPENVQSELYQAPATCLSIYRLLPPLAKFYVMSMVFYEMPISLKDIEKWCHPSHKRHQFESLKRLKALHLIEENKEGTHVRLHQTFRKNFRDCLTGSQRPGAFGHLCTTEDEHAVSIRFLDSFASQKWESILHFMVGTDLGVTPSNSVLSLLKLGKLMEGPMSQPRNLVITNKGFQFLLQDINAQIWTLLLQYLNLTQDLNMEPVDVLNFIFILGSLELGKSYMVSNLSGTQISMLADLKEYGLIYQRDDRSERFYPTRLATTLTSDATGLKTRSAVISQSIESTHNNSTDDPENSTANSSCSIIVETNFKIYAYTNSPLDIAILNLFVHLKTRFANMVCGQITRESIRGALLNGITADQIVKYLEAHAHPQMKALAKEKLEKKVEFDTTNNINTAGGPSLYGKGEHVNPQHKLEIIPPTVVDQIKLWQLELDRIQTVEGYLFKDFANQQEFNVLCNYASEIGVLSWADKTKRKFFVPKEGFSQVADFASRNQRR